MIDYDFENRLVERIALREIIAAANLDPRQKRVLRRHSCGDVFAEIGRQEGITGARANQIYHRAIEKIRHRRSPVLSPKPRPEQPSTPSFDKAEFLEHMQRLIVAREVRERDGFDREVHRLNHLLRAEFGPPPAPPPTLADLLAMQAEAERQRQEAEAAAASHAKRVAEFYAQERLEWTGCLLSAIAECEGTPYAVLIPQMRADIANIESQPPGALPWRFDREAFKRHFASFKAKVGVPHV